MSRAIARADRVPLDAYYTPDALAKHLVGLLPLRAADVTFEPHAGGGAFIRALIPRVYSVAALDIDPNAPGLAQAHFPEVGDFLTASIPHCTWIIGNPPYSNAEAHVRRALDVTWRHVAFLLRLGFLESRKRLAFWREHPCRKVWVLAERPSFTGGGTDSAAYGWFWWDAQHDGPTTLEITSWK